MSKKKRFLGHWKEGHGYVVVDRGYGKSVIHMTVNQHNWQDVDADDWVDADALAYVKSVADALNAAEIYKA